MITFDFEYYRPPTFREAVNTFKGLSSQGKEPVYYAGGTEIISLSRMNQMNFNAVIDIKDIPECNVMEFQGGNLIVGAAVTLTKICEANLFPLLAKTARGTADHTTRSKITLGGNICGKIPYREAVLPFLLCDSQAVIAGEGGLNTYPLNQIFSGVLRLKKGEFLLQLITDKDYIDLPHHCLRRTKQSSIDYPLLTLVAIMKDKKMRVAFSGISSHPYRDTELEDLLNDSNIQADDRINKALEKLPAQIVTDLQGSADYKEFILRNSLKDVINRMGGNQNASGAV